MKSIIKRMCICKSASISVGLHCFSSIFKCHRLSLVMIVLANPISICLSLSLFYSLRLFFSPTHSSSLVRCIDATFPNWTSGEKWLGSKFALYIQTNDRKEQSSNCVMTTVNKIIFNKYYNNPQADSVFRMCTLPIPEKPKWKICDFDIEA